MENHIHYEIRFKKRGVGADYCQMINKNLGQTTNKKENPVSWYNCLVLLVAMFIRLCLLRGQKAP